MNMKTLSFLPNTYSIQELLISNLRSSNFALLNDENPGARLQWIFLEPIVLIHLKMNLKDLGSVYTL